MLCVERLPTRKLVLDSKNDGTGLSLFSSAKRNILKKSYTLMESYAEHIPASNIRSSSTLLARSDKVTHISLADLFKLVLDISEGDEALHTEE